MKKIHYLSKEESDKLLNNINNKKHLLITTLMLDAGLRITEASKLQLQHIDFKKRLLIIESLKKRNNKKIRIIPISNRLYQTFGEYLEHSKLDLQPNNYLFPSTSSTNGYINRITTWRTLKNIGNKLNIENLHPHTLRHTFATHHLNDGTKLEEIKEMLGHANYNTTLIYASIPTTQLATRINSVTSKKSTFLTKIYQKILPKKTVKLININFTEHNFCIGRNQTINQIETNISKQINTILIGNIGVGKSKILESLKINQQTLYLNDTDNIKKSLIQILLYIFQDKKTMLNKIWENIEIEEITKKIQRENTINLCDLITANVKPKQYILIIDNITNITTGGKKVIEKLKDTFIFLTAARQIKTVDISFLWNFETIKINELNRENSIQLIQQLAIGLETENLETFRNHIYEQSNGNPRAIYEMIDRYQKEPFITNEIVREIKHSGALPDIDMSWIIVFFFLSITTLRYMSRELDEPALRLLGSMGLIALIALRPIFQLFKKRFIA